MHHERGVERQRQRALCSQVGDHRVAPGAADLAQSPRGAGIGQKYLTPRGLRILAALDAVAARHAAQPGEVALAWLMARPGVTAPIASASNVAQVEGLVRATQLQLSADDVEALDAASAPEAA